MGKWPCPWSAVSKIASSFVVVPDSCLATAMGLRFVWPEFLVQLWPSPYIDTPEVHEFFQWVSSDCERGYA
jgi:hypothetical protein